MAKITELPLADALDGLELLPLVQNGAMKRASYAEFAAPLVAASSALSRFYATRAAGASAVVTGEWFTSAEEGYLAYYERVGGAPNYVNRGPVFAGASARDIAANEYTLTNADSLVLLRFTAETAVTVTVPAGLAPNFHCSLLQWGLGEITVVADVGVTLAEADGQFTSQAQFVRLALLPVGVDEYVLEGRTK